MCAFNYSVWLARPYLIGCKTAAVNWVHCVVYITTRESLIGHSGWALPHYTEMGHSRSSFWGTASPGRGSNARPPVPMTLNISSHRRIGRFNPSQNSSPWHRPLSTVTKSIAMSPRAPPFPRRAKIPICNNSYLWKSLMFGVISGRSIYKVLVTVHHCIHCHFVWR